MSLPTKQTLHNIFFPKKVRKRAQKTPHTKHQALRIIWNYYNCDADVDKHID